MLAKLVGEVGAVESKEAISHPCQLNGNQRRMKLTFGWDDRLLWRRRLLIDRKSVV